MKSGCWCVLASACCFVLSGTSHGLERLTLTACDLSEVGCGGRVTEVALGGFSPQPLPPLQPSSDLPGKRRLEFDLTAKVANLSVVTDEENWASLSTELWTFNGMYPGPLLEGEVGDTFVVHFHNDLPVASSVHWHGIPAPVSSDGSLEAVPPGGSRDYEFRLATPGLKWFHSHVDGFKQVERGLYGVLMVREEGGVKAEMEMLGLGGMSGVTEELVVLHELDLQKNGSGVFGYPQGLSPLMYAQMVHNGKESGVMLVNGRPVSAGLNVKVGAGPLRLRILNGATARFARLAVREGAGMGNGFPLSGPSVFRVGGDGGLISGPIEVTPIGFRRGTASDGSSVVISEPDPRIGLMLTPGERADLIIVPPSDQPAAPQQQQQGGLRGSGSMGGDGEMSMAREISLEWHDKPRGRLKFVDGVGFREYLKKRVKAEIARERKRMKSLDSFLQKHPGSAFVFSRQGYVDMRQSTPLDWDRLRAVSDVWGLGDGEGSVDLSVEREQIAQDFPWASGRKGAVEAGGDGEKKGAEGGEEVDLDRIVVGVQFQEVLKSEGKWRKQPVDKSGDALWVGCTSSTDCRRSLVGFDWEGGAFEVDGVPVDSVSLRFPLECPYGVRGGSGGMRVALHEVTQEWGGRGDGRATWLSAVAPENGEESGGVPWTSEGGTFGVSPIAESVANCSKATKGDGKTFEIVFQSDDLTERVKCLLDSSCRTREPSLGFVLKETEENSGPLAKRIKARKHHPFGRRQGEGTEDDDANPDGPILVLHLAEEQEPSPSGMTRRLDSADPLADLMAALGPPPSGPGGMGGNGTAMQMPKEMVMGRLTPEEDASTAFMSMAPSPETRAFMIPDDDDGHQPAQRLLTFSFAAPPTESPSQSAAYVPPAKIKTVTPLIEDGHVPRWEKGGRKNGKGPRVVRLVYGHGMSDPDTGHLPMFIRSDDTCGSARSHALHKHAEATMKAVQEVKRGSGEMESMKMGEMDMGGMQMGGGGGMMGEFEGSMHSTVLCAEPGELLVLEIVNPLPGDHNFHFHGFDFQVLSTSWEDPGSEGGFFPMPPVRVAGVALAREGSGGGGGWRAGPGEAVVEMKDTVWIPGKAKGASQKGRGVVRLAFRVEPYGRSLDELSAMRSSSGDPGVEGGPGWPFHCHMLTHHEAGMEGIFYPLRPSETKEGDGEAGGATAVEVGGSGSASVDIVSGAGGGEKDGTEGLDRTGTSEVREEPSGQPGSMGEDGVSLTARTQPDILLEKEMEENPGEAQEITGVETDREGGAVEGGVGEREDSGDRVSVEGGDTDRDEKNEDSSDGLAPPPISPPIPSTSSPSMIQDGHSQIPPADAVGGETPIPPSDPEEEEGETLPPPTDTAELPVPPSPLTETGARKKSSASLSLSRSFFVLILFALLLTLCGVGWTLYRRKQQQRQYEVVSGVTRRIDETRRGLADFDEEEGDTPGNRSLFSLGGGEGLFSPRKMRVPAGLAGSSASERAVDEFGEATGNSRRSGGI